MMQKTIQKKIKLIILLFSLIFPSIFFRLFYIQFILHSSFAESASRNLDRYVDIPPRRGCIYDRNGILLAKTAPSYDVFLCLHDLFHREEQAISNVPSQKYNQESIRNLGQLLEIPYPNLLEQIENICQRVDRSISFKLREHLPLAKTKPSKFKTIRKGIEYDFYNRKYLFLSGIPYRAAQTMLCDECAWEIKGDQSKIVNKFPGFKVVSSISRQYPFRDNSSHILGHVGVIDDVRKYPKEKGYRRDDLIGRSGIEGFYESDLRGKRGFKVQTRKEFIYSERSEDGMDTFLTLDFTRQKFAEQLLDEMVQKTKTATGGAAVVVDIQSGEVLVMATSPRYDNNRFSQDYSRLCSAPDFPLINRAISYRYNIPPGSVFKIAVALYALEKGIIDRDTTFYCSGYLYAKAKKRFRCTHVHHEVNLSKAIEGSCNIFFYQVGEKMGPAMLEECARLFGYGEKRLGMPEELAGLVPTPEWKKKMSNEVWYPGDSRMFGIGQLLEATPIQVAGSMAMVATGGSMPELKIVKEIKPHVDMEYVKDDEFSPEGLDWVSGNRQGNLERARITHQFPVHQRNWLLVKDAMEKVVSGKYGTAQNIAKQLGDLKIASKTGTSQVKGSSPSFLLCDIKDPFSLLKKITDEKNAVSRYIQESFSSETKAFFSRNETEKVPFKKWQQILARELNYVLVKKSIYPEALERNVELRQETQESIFKHKEIQAQIIRELAGTREEIVPLLDEVGSIRELAEKNKEIKALIDENQKLRRSIQQNERQIIRSNRLILEDTYSEILKVSHGRPDHAWFAGFAPADDPKYAFAVLIEHGGYGGSVAAPVAAKIIKCFFP